MTINGTDVEAPYMAIFNGGVTSTEDAITKIDTVRKNIYLEQEFKTHLLRSDAFSKLLPNYFNLFGNDR